MSAAVPVRAAELIDGAVHELHTAQREIKSLQQKIHDPWLARQLADIEDRIFTALNKLGD